MSGSLAILNRELIASSRRKRYFGMRAFYLGVLFLFILGAWLATDAVIGRQFSPSRGAKMFASFAYVQLFLVLAFAPPICSDLLSGERRRGTLEILLTTGQSSWRIVWNKVLSRFLYLELLILSSVAAMSLIGFFGGVTWVQVLLIFVILSTTALQWCCIAIWLSSVFREGHASATLCYLLMILGLALLPALFRSGRVFYWPLVSCYVSTTKAVESFAASGAERLATAWLHVGSTLLVSGLACLGAACSVRDTNPLQLTAPLTGLLVRLRRLLPGRLKRRADERPPRPVTGDPITWREVNTGVFGKADRPIHAVIVYAGIVVVACVAWHEDASISSLLIVLGGMLWASTTFMALQISSACIAIEKEKGTLDLILAMPISTDDLLQGKLRGVYRHIRPRAATALAVSAIGLCWLSFLDILIGLFCIAMGVAVLICATMLGLYCSARSQTQAAAFVRSLVVAVFLALGMLLLTGFVAAAGFGPFAGIVTLALLFMLVAPGFYGSALANIDRLRIEHPLEVRDEK